MPARLHILVLMLLVTSLAACRPHGDNRDDDENTDDDDSATQNDDDDDSGGDTGSDGLYGGTVSGLISTSEFPALPCTGSVSADVDGGGASGNLTCAFTLPCEGSWSTTPIPSTTTLVMTDCLGEVAPIDLSWSGETLLGRVFYTEESKEFGAIEITISFDAFLTD